MRCFGRLAAACVLLTAVIFNGPARSADEPQPERVKHPANRLAKESSPYLLLHAHNPVDWYPWGPDAFEAAKQQNKPIFLSIGYSSCYWCHVMERLVFENPEIAKTMNENFINVKVDREERPDVDDIYMTSLIVYYQLIGSPQSGGWPLSMFLTPEGKPFAGGTYFPPADIDGRLGFPSVTARVQGLWTEKEQEIRNNADVVTQHVQRQMKPKLTLQEIPLEQGLVDSSVKSLIASYDPERGGIDFNPARAEGPKFPVPAKLRLLMNRARHHNDEDSRKIVLHTLEAIAMGGIRDHLAGGFHRYSTDREWLVPHFEKMLYDQAQLVPLYLDAWELTGRPLFREAATSTLDFVLREMTGANGEFYSALDAETESIEGKSYVWSREEILTTLGETDGTQFCEVFGLNEPNPFEHGFVLHLPRSVADTAKKLGVDEAQLNERIVSWKSKLLAVRNARPQPLLDDKSLASWNGLMIGAFAQAGRVLEEPRYTAAAVRAAEFLTTHMRQPSGALFRTARKGEAKLNAYLDDYAFSVDGLLQLHQTTGDARWLDDAKALTQTQIEQFWDTTGHAFYFTSHDHEALIARTKNAYDAVLPAGNSVAAGNLVKLAKLTGDQKYLEQAAQTLQVFAPVFTESPRGMSVMSLALMDYLAATKEGKKESSEADAVPLESTVPVSFQLEEAHKVKLQPFLNVDRLPPGKTCRIVLYVDIEKGWHINSNPPQPDFYPPTVFQLKSTEGLTLKNIKYPTGKEFRVEGIDEPLHVYEGKIAIYGELEVPAGAAGKSDTITVELVYQACDDKRCLRKMTATVGGKVPVAASADDVKPANEKHFPK